LNAPADLDRVILIVFDSVGCGELPDARDYGDTGSDTSATFPVVFRLPFRIFAGSVLQASRR